MAFIVVLSANFIYRILEGPVEPEKIYIESYILGPAPDNAFKRIMQSSLSSVGVLTSVQKSKRVINCVSGIRYRSGF